MNYILFYKDDKGDLFARSLKGGKVPINLDETPSSLTETKLESNTTDTTQVKKCLNKLCLISNQIVKTQLKLDKLNLALKQLNILQTIRLNTNNFVAEKSFFAVEKQFISGSAQLEITITNKNAHLDDNFNGSYLVMCSVQLNKALFQHESLYWLSKCEQFVAIKPNTKHIVKFDLLEHVRNKFFPLRVNIYLVFDTRNYLDCSAKSDNKLYSNLNEQFLFESNKMCDNYSLSEFSVCIHQSKFNLNDLFNENGEISNRMCDINEFSMQFNLLMNCNQRLNANKNLEGLWTRLSMDGIAENEHFFLKYLKCVCQSIKIQGCFSYLLFLTFDYNLYFRLHRIKRES